MYLSLFSQNWVSFIIIILCSAFEIKIYSLISDYKFKLLNLKNIIIIIIISIIQFIISFTILNKYRMIISYLIILLQYKCIFKENNKITIIKTLIINLTSVVIEAGLSILVINTNVLNFSIINNETVLFKNLFTILLILCTGLLFYIKFINKNIRKLVNLIDNYKLKPLKLCLILLNILAITIIMQFATEINKTNYFLNIVFLIIVLILYAIATNNYIKIEKLDERQKILLHSISTYEKLIDKDQIMQHEILNNLLILNSFENKNSKEFNDFLISIIKDYDTKELKKYTNINKLPPGIKGIFYYKLNEIETLNIKLTFYYSKELDGIWEKISNKDFIRLCKIVGIFLDNAIEATIASKEKNLIIDLYRKETNLIIYIENSTDSKVTINKMAQKNYSTKQGHLGLGLYLAYSLKKETNKIKINQTRKNKRFISEIKVEISK